jgi:hypothetical protein
MVKLNRTVRMLQAKREELLDQLDAVDKALAALNGAKIAVAEAPARNPRKATEEAGSPVVPTRVKPQRVLSDEHKHALIEGRRKARQSKDVAAGLAREMADLSPGLALASSDAGRLPRLVKRQEK